MSQELDLISGPCYVHACIVELCEQQLAAFIDDESDSLINLFMKCKNFNGILNHDFVNGLSFYFVKTKQNLIVVNLCWYFSNLGSQ